MSQYVRGEFLCVTKDSERFSPTIFAEHQLHLLDSHYSVYQQSDVKSCKHSLRVAKTNDIYKDKKNNYSQCGEARRGRCGGGDEHQSMFPVNIQSHRRKFDDDSVSEYLTNSLSGKQSRDRERKCRWEVGNANVFTSERYCR
ncbi:hypothetical protein J6590_046035 [Homalodisca vitripennis]|nr:hypothetical protein J6590_046035 [Homalodisca vitripennis]